MYERQSWQTDTTDREAILEKRQPRKRDNFSRKTILEVRQPCSKDNEMAPKNRQPNRNIIRVDETILLEILTMVKYAIWREGVLDENT
jgi:hypothetical protein